MKRVAHLTFTKQLLRCYFPIFSTLFLWRRDGMCNGAERRERERLTVAVAVAVAGWDSNGCARMV